MRRILALLVLTLAPLALGTLALTTPAHAGGPTSVLITEPATGDAAGLSYADETYSRLDGMLVGAVPLDREPSGLGDRSINLTWMIHDVSPWRTQQLYPEADGGPALSTYDEQSGTTTWARVGEGKAVVSLLDQVLRPGAEPDLSAVDLPAPAATERVVTQTAWWSLSGWRWAVLGLLAGAGAVLLVGRRGSSPGPRRELIDLDPAAQTSGSVAMSITKR